MFVKSKSHTRLLSNFVSLSILQGANFILPLITIPYLTIVLGVEKFGLLAFAMAFISYFNIITDYGFNLTATKEISIHRENRDKIIEIFSSVMSIKFSLMITSLIFMSIIVFSFEKFSEYWFIYFYTFGMVLGQSLFPLWFFQGIEEMKYITYLNILAKSIFTIAIFIFIETPNDYYLVPIFNSIGFIISGLLSLLLIYKKFHIRFKFQKIETILFYLKDSWHIFLSSIFTTFYTVSTIFILGLFTNNQIVGYYSLAEKIVKGVGSLFTPINSAIFPYVSKMKIDYPNKAIKFINKITIYSAIIMFILSVFLFIYARELILLLSNNNFIDSIIILQILSFFPFVIVIATIFSTNYFINFNLKHLLSKIYMYSAILSMILSFTFIPLYGAIGASISVMIVEIFATLYMYLMIQRRILN